ncbi:MAG: hypothetical protein HKM23_01040 [Nitrosopumilus sp.]|nr:hypothetical protein [Nitrosopumilus sp.]NNM35851.1 hypothetical protein [Nitrosopumilus sp.]
MKICSICHKISATEQDHLDCIQRRSIELEDENFKNEIPEKLNISKDSQALGVEVRAILEHLTKEKEES